MTISVGTLNLTELASLGEETLRAVAALTARALHVANNEDGEHAAAQALAATTATLSGRGEPDPVLSNLLRQTRSKLNELKAIQSQIEAVTAELEVLAEQVSMLK